MYREKSGMLELGNSHLSRWYTLPVTAGVKRIKMLQFVIGKYGLLDFSFPLFLPLFSKIFSEKTSTSYINFYQMRRLEENKREEKRKKEE